MSRQNSEDASVILPIWHGVSREDVMGYSPSLADKVAVRSETGIDEVARQLLASIRPQGSTLLIARDHLLDWGCNPPVITDDWWLDVIAAAASNPVEDTFQAASGWGRWGFPLPPPANEPPERGWRLAWAAMQKEWQEDAEARPITQTTRPKLVHDFIASHPGLTETCHDYTQFLIAYAPQLVIPGFGGEFEAEIETLYRESAARGEARRASHDPAGSALTMDGEAPGCDEEFAVRDPEFGRYSPAHVAYAFVQGSNPVSGPEVRFYEIIDYVAWLLSSESEWVPARTRRMLTRGMAEWGMWHWYRGEVARVAPEEELTGAFSSATRRARNRQTLRLGTRAKKDLEHRLGLSASALNLPESGETLAYRLMSGDFLDAYFEGRDELNRRRKR